MKITRLRVTLLLLTGCIAVWLIFVGFESWQRETPVEARPERWHSNYSLIEDGLYMGGLVPEPPPDTQVVLNLCESKDRYQVETAIWETIPDAPPAPSLDWLRQRVEEVDGHRRAGKTVFVHCSAGRSRSGMVVVAYEMLKNNWPRDRALEFVRSKRSIARPNPAFMELLLEWERELKSPPPGQDPPKN
jgi:hypothetical protein